MHSHILCSALAGALVCLSAATASAHDLAVTVRDQAGRPVADAVVTVHASQGAPVKITPPYKMSQKDLAFHPFVLIAPVGSTVEFPNNDKVRHHVYSFSPAKRFQLKLYSGDESRSVVFDKAGIVALGCNIHDQMVGFIDVVDTPWAAKTDASGRAVITGAPSGAVTLSVWHPWLKTRDAAISRKASLPSAGEAFTLEIRPPAPKGE